MNSSLNTDNSSTHTINGTKTINATNTYYYYEYNLIYSMYIYVTITRYYYKLLL